MWLSSKLASAIGGDLSKKTFFNELNQSYEVHINRNSSEILNLISACINRTILGIYCLLQIITNIFLITFILIALFVINWKTTLIGFLIFATSYISIAFLTKKTQ